MSEFTKGPWTAFIGGKNPTVSGPYLSGHIAIVSGGRNATAYTDGMDRATAIANTHLVASAPELYEALKEAPCTCLFRPVAGKAERELIPCKRCAAIAKAEGR